MPRRLLLLGGGPSHAQVLAAFAREPLPDAEIALISAEAHLTLPQCLPAFVAGRWRAEACRVDTAQLTAAAGATWIRGRITGFDAATRRVQLGDGSEIDADGVSIDEPAAIDRDSLPGAREHALALHPAGPFVTLFDGLVDLAARRPIDLVVVGQGAPAVEIALALAERLSPAHDERARIALVLGPEGLLPGWPPAALEQARRALQRGRITVFEQACTRLTGDAALLDNGARLACDAAVLATPPSPPPWLAASGLALADDGLPAVDAAWRSRSHPQVLAPARTGPRDGEVLARQWRRALSAGPMAPARPAASSLRWLRCGRGRALVAWGSWVMAGHAVGAWCARRDARAWALAQPIRSAGS